MLSDGQHRSQGAGVVVVRMEQRQAREDIRARCDISVAFLFVEIRAEGGKRRLDFLVGGWHHVIRIGRKDVGERFGRGGGHDNSGCTK